MKKGSFMVTQKAGFARLAVLVIALCSSSSVFAGTDSYRWLHVTINTPWSIFLFLLPMVLFPIVLMAVLYWRVALDKSRAAAAKAREPSIVINNEKPSEV